MPANSTGVYQKDNGYWEYRFVMMVDGKKVNKKKATDAFGNKLKTQKEAIKAREAAMLEARVGKVEKPKVSRRMVKDVYKEYCEKGRKDRAPFANRTAFGKITCSLNSATVMWMK